MVTITINVIWGDTLRNLQELIAKMQNLTPFMTSLTELVSDKIESNFIQQDWPPLKASTLYYKAIRGFPADILVRTGELKDAAISKDWQVSRDLAELAIPGYGGFHIEGTSFMPARDFTMMPDSLIYEIAEEFVNYIYG